MKGRGEVKEIERGRERKRKRNKERKRVREGAREVVIKWRWSRNKRSSSYLLIED